MENAEDKAGQKCVPHVVTSYVTAKGEQCFSAISQKLVLHHADKKLKEEKKKRVLQL